METREMNIAVAKFATMLFLIFITMAVTFYTLGTMFNIP
jgi:uncharacterized protein (DUF2164 family)